jgi:hypothetical protein
VSPSVMSLTRSSSTFCASLRTSLVLLLIAVVDNAFCEIGNPGDHAENHRVIGEDGVVTRGGGNQPGMAIKMAEDLDHTAAAHGGYNDVPVIGGVLRADAEKVAMLDTGSGHALAVDFEEVEGARPVKPFAIDIDCPLKFRDLNRIHGQWQCAGSDTGLWLRLTVPGTEETLAPSVAIRPM